MDILLPITVLALKASPAIPVPPNFNTLDSYSEIRVLARLTLIMFLAA